MRNALITGGTGFLGKRLAQRLLDEGWNITVYARNEAVGHELSQAGIRFHRGDLLNATQITQACKGQDIVFHCAALSSPWGAYRDFYASNVQGTNHVVEGCIMHNVQRLVHVSTSSVYFDYTDRLFISELLPLPVRPANHYAATKRMAEQVVMQAHIKGVPSIIIRPRAIFGPGDTTLLPRLMHANDTGGIPMFRKGQIQMDLTYVDNVVDALIRCANAPESAMGTAYNITNQEPIVLLDILNQLYKELGQSLQVRNLSYPITYGLAGLMELYANMFRTNTEPLLTRFTVGVLAKHQTLDSSLAIEKLGYQPSVSMDEGIRKFAEWWRSQQ